MSIPEIATQIINKSLSQQPHDTCRTIIIVGTKSVGKSTVLSTFLEKTEVPRETLVLDYSFGRKSNQKQGLEKSICHVWEYGGKLNILKNVLSTIPIQGKLYFCIMLDISKIKRIWNTLEICLQAMNEAFTDANNLPELLILGGKYDLFKNYDSEIKKLICTTIRSVALLFEAHLLFYSSKEPQLARRAKELFYGIGFGNGVPFKERNSNFTKPLVIPKGTDSWDHIGVAKCNLEQIKARHTSRIESEPDLPPEAASTALQRSHPEPVLDSIAALKYDELRNLEFQDISVNDYLRAMH